MTVHPTHGAAGWLEAVKAAAILREAEHLIEQTPHLARRIGIDPARPMVEQLLQARCERFDRQVDGRTAVDAVDSVIRVHPSDRLNRFLSAYFAGDR